MELIQKVRLYIDQRRACLSFVQIDPLGTLDCQLYSFEIFFCILVAVVVICYFIKASIDESCISNKKD